MKTISFEHLKKEKLPESEYEYLVNETAKMLKRPYIQVHRMVEAWDISKIRNRLTEAQKHHGNLTPQIYWFWKRKKDKES